MQYKNALALRTSLETGLRIDDVLRLKTTSIRKCTLFGIAKKTGKSFRKVVSRDLAKRLGEISGEIYVFEGRLDPKKHRTRQAVWKDVKKAAKMLEIDGNIAPHSARKTYGVQLFRDSGIGAVKKELQHNDIQTTMLYAFADYLDGFPSEVTRTKTTKTSKKEVPAQTEEVPQTLKLDGDFWIAFAELVAYKTAKKLIQILNS